MSKPTSNELIMRSLRFLLIQERAKIAAEGSIRGAYTEACDLVEELDAAIEEAEDERS